MNYDADAARALRDAEVQALGLLDGDLPDALAPIARAAAITAGASGAEINIIDDDYQHTVVSAYGSPGRGAADESYCATIVLEPGLVHHVPDARLDSRFADKPVTRSGEIRSYAAVQLVTTNKAVVGTICVFDPTSVKADERTLRVLSALADSAMVLIEMRRRTSDLRQAVGKTTRTVGELRRANSQLAAFAAEVSTDLRNPLTVLMFNLQLLTRGRVGGRIQRDLLLQRALTTTQSISATVTGMLSYAEVGGRPVPELMATADLVRDTATSLGIPASSIEVAALPDLWGDELQIGLVLRALLGNVIEHVGAAARVKVTGARNHNGVRINICDNGPGVAERMRWTIFRPFAGGDSGEAGDIGVRGSGLATSRNIVNAHKGSIGVDEAAGWRVLLVRTAEPALAERAQFADVTTFGARKMGSVQRALIRRRLRRGE